MDWIQVDSNGGLPSPWGVLMDTLNWVNNCHRMHVVLLQCYQLLDWTVGGRHIGNLGVPLVSV